MCRLYERAYPHRTTDEREQVSAVSAARMTSLIARACIPGRETGYPGLPEKMTGSSRSPIMVRKCPFCHPFRGDDQPIIVTYAPYPVTPCQTRTK